jgi:hypothetical protein
MIVDYRMLTSTPQGRATPIEIEIAIEIGKLPVIDCDHDFDFDTEQPRFENKNALDKKQARIGQGSVQDNSSRP